MVSAGSTTCSTNNLVPVYEFCCCHLLGDYFNQDDGRQTIQLPLILYIHLLFSVVSSARTLSALYTHWLLHSHWTCTLNENDIIITIRHTEEIKIITKSRAKTSSLIAMKFFTMIIITKPTNH